MEEPLCPQPADPRLPGFRAGHTGNRAELHRSDAPIPESRVEL